MKVKVKLSRYRPGLAQKVGRGIALLFHDRGTRRRWVVSSTPRPHFTPGKDPVPILQKAEWAPGPVWTGGKSRPHRYSIPDRPVRSRSLYWLSYPANTLRMTYLFFSRKAMCYIFWGGVCSLNFPVCNAHAPYFHLWPVRLYYIEQSLINDMIFGEKNYWAQNVFWFWAQHVCFDFEHKMFVLILSTKYLFWFWAQNVCFDFEHKMFVLIFSTKCVSWFWAQNVCFDFEHKMCVLILSTKCMFWFWAQNVFWFWAQNVSFDFEHKMCVLILSTRCVFWFWAQDVCFDFEHKMCVLILSTKRVSWFWAQNVCFDFLYNFVWNTFHSKKDWARYDQKYVSVFT